jgi:hypothetical protein
MRKWHDLLSLSDMIYCLLHKIEVQNKHYKKEERENS